MCAFQSKTSLSLGRLLVSRIARLFAVAKDAKCKCPSRRFFRIYLKTKAFDVIAWKRKYSLKKEEEEGRKDKEEGQGGRRKRIYESQSKCYFLLFLQNALGIFIMTDSFMSNSPYNLL